MAEKPSRGLTPEPRLANIENLLRKLGNDNRALQRRIEALEKDVAALKAAAA